MSMTSISVTRPVTGIMVFVALTILGLFTFSRLKIDMYPDIDMPIIAVITSYTGADPEAIEQLVTKPIEEAVASVENVDTITSTSQEHVSIVIVKLIWGIDMDKAETDVRRKLEMYAYDNLPVDAKQPYVIKFDPSMMPVVFMAANIPGTPVEVRKLAEDEVEPFLSRQPGVASATVSGGDEREIHVRLHPEWLQAYGIGPSQVVQAIKAANMMIPSGSLDQGPQELGLRTTSEIKEVSQLENVLVGARGGQPVYLRDIADIKDAYQEKESFTRVNHKDAVLVFVQKQSDANTVQVVNAVLKSLPELEKRLPAGSKMNVIMESAEPIMKAVSNLASTGALSVVLTALVLLAFLRSLRTSAIVFASIPLSMLATFAVMDNQGLTLNIISMAGLALAVGMLVDNSVVVLENIFSHMEMGEDRKTAAIKGTEEMAMPITASTLTTVVVFVPVLFVTGIAGQMFRELSLTICFSLLSSLVIALTLVPLLSSLTATQHRNWFEKLIGLLTFWIDPLANLYAKVIAWVMRHRWLTIFAGFAVLGSSIYLAKGLDVDFMARMDQGRVSFKVKTAPGTSVWTTNEVFEEIERIIEETVPERASIMAQLGSDGSNTFSSLQGMSSYSGSIRLKTVDRKYRNRSIGEIELALRERFNDLPGVEIQIQKQGGMGSSGDLELNVFCEDLNQLAELMLMLKNKVQALPGVLDATLSSDSGIPEVKIDLDREQIRLLGMTPVEVASAISVYYLGATATYFRDAGDEYKILVRTPEESRADIEKLRAMPIVTPYGVVPLETVARLETSLGPAKIMHETKRRMGTLAISKTDDIALGALQKIVEEEVKKADLPDGVTYEISGSAKDMQESMLGLLAAVLVGIVLVYMVMASQFESLLEPFAILLSIPISFAGVIFAMLITHTTVQMTVMIGCLLLVGIVVNNGIVLLDVLKNKRAAGVDLVTAAIDAARSRLRPFLMTTITTILGMVPMAMELGDGSEMWAPMGRAVVGGMTVALCLTLVVVPAVYVTMVSIIERVKAWFSGSPKPEGGGSAPAQAPAAPVPAPAAAVAVAVAAPASPEATVSVPLPAPEASDPQFAVREDT